MTDATDYKDKIIDIISTVLEKRADENCSRENEELWDSIAQISIIVSLEKELSIKIPQEKISEINSVKNIIKIISELWWINRIGWIQVTKILLNKNLTRMQILKH